ncbi:CHRD domain-containing protein [Rufibacter roseus]|uniref:CHRD domain-containing protein n=1 Tax=Rufibacter roseus TaxID=1567108 RepID=A0ABW2DRB6_9BACT|nr:CHRD domain-containing protein [Rufibacter roseus]
MFLFLSVLLSGCGNDDEDDQSHLVKFKNSTLSGANEVPANNSQATGTFSGTYDKNTKVLSYNITFTGITPTNMHFHKGAAGASGPVAVGIGASPYTSPINSQTAPLTTEQEADLLAGNWYVNIHSSQFPAGELRGQVTQ